ncbi:MAG: RNase adapter RapZ [Clostridia bacterium]|nr:RNase adapter RapZ [Clostridia bacterium]MBN2882358.1 RNase adapter RapZ [Clostridia bacterium]
MKLYIITGMSGAGKSLAMRTLEDRGYFCIDNLPPSLIPKFAQLGAGSGQMENVAVTVDIRGAELLSDIFPALDELDAMQVPYEIIFLETLDKVLVKRYQETRRQHPLESKGLGLEEAIEKERNELEGLKKRADYIVDSSGLMPKELKNELLVLLNQGEDYEQIIINIVSFGFKYGSPLDCDNILDVRFIPNPYYNSSMRKLTGRNETVSNYVLKQNITEGFIERSIDLFEHILPGYISEGKNQVVIGIGCTGGRHRSVAIAEEISRILTEKNHRVILTHRDISKDSKR